MGRFQHDQYVEVTVHFRCNLKCEHCMIEGTMDWLKPESKDDLQRVLDVNASEGKWKGLILTGSEVTLRADLPEYARLARAHGFEHVRIQTHGMRLAKKDYCRELVEAGIDEYFVSVTAADAPTHDHITQVPGSFDKTLKGLENLDEIDGITILTNTVVTRQSYTQLPRLVQTLGHLKRLAQMDFWNYWPMSETDVKNLLVPHTDVLPFLKKAIVAARGLGRSVEVKNFPECLLADLGDALNNDQPQLIIDSAFWPEFQRNGFNQCVHRDVCGSRTCLGLNTAYVRKYGWQEELLKPLPADPRPQSKSDSAA